MIFLNKQGLIKLRCFELEAKVPGESTLIKNTQYHTHKENLEKRLKLLTKNI